MGVVFNMITLQKERRGTNRIEYVCHCVKMHLDPILYLVKAN